MPKSRTRGRRYPVDKEPHPLITTAEARAEAAYMAMQSVLKRLPRSICKSVMIDCYQAADMLGVPAITEEVECIFSEVQFEPPTR